MDDPAPPPRRRPYWLWLLIGAIAVGVLLFILDSQFPGVLSDGNTQPHIAHHVIWLVVLVSALFAGRRMPAGTMLRYAVIWIAIAAALVLAYSYRADFRNMGDRIMGELRPDRALVSPGGEITIRRSGDGHFHLTATADGKNIRFMVDTGATMVALSVRDAKAIGFDPDRLNYGIRTRTANGIAMVAPVSIGRIEAGPIVVRDVEAAVSRRGLGQSLLGLSFLNRLSGYEVRGDTMILKP